jgi:branched-chain amino acid transport system permease protein
MKFYLDTAYSDRLRLLRDPLDRALYALLLAALVAAPFVLPRFYVGELAYLFVLCIASLGLMLLTGYTGQVSLGHAAFVAIGAYAHALLLAKGWPAALSLPAAALVAAGAGVAVGIPAIRTSGLYLAMVTLAFAFVAEHVLGHWKSLTGGYTGLAVPEVAWLKGLTAYYFLCLGILVAVLTALVNLLRSGAGRALVAVRDSEAGARALGIPVARTRIAAFGLSAALCGLAGGLMAHHLKFLTPDAFNLLLSMELVLMVVIGGLGTLHGAVFGAVLIGLLPPFISLLKPLLPARVAAQSGLELFVFGLVLTLFVLFEPKGMYGRWLKLRAIAETFPLYRRDTFRRVKTYMRSERHR